MWRNRSKLFQSNIFWCSSFCLLSSSSKQVWKNIINQFVTFYEILIRWNPFAKKYGIFGVIHAHSKRNRVVSKHGKLNTYRKPDENREKHRYKYWFTIHIKDRQNIQNNYGVLNINHFLASWTINSILDYKKYYMLQKLIST